jgi:hypothetical protein
MSDSRRQEIDSAGSLLARPDMDEKERMQPLFSTRGAHPRERFDYWHEVARKNIVYHDVQPDNRL